LPRKNKKLTEEILDWLMVCLEQLKIRIVCERYEQSMVFDRFFSRRSEEKKFFLSFFTTPSWEALDKLDRDIIASYYGFDLPENTTRTAEQVSKQFGLKVAHIYYSLRRARTILIGRTSYRTEIRSGIRHRASEDVWIKKRIQDKEALIKIYKTPVWDKLSKDHQEILNFYYGLDLAGSETRTIRDVAEKYSLRLWEASRRIWRARARLASLDPTIAFQMSLAKKGGRHVVRKKSLLVIDAWGKERIQDKEVLLKVFDTPLWYELDKDDRERLSFCYGLDLPGNEVRMLKSVAEKYRVPLYEAKQQIWKAKEKLVSLDPSLTSQFSRLFKISPRESSANKTKKEVWEDEFDGKVDTLKIYQREIKRFPEMDDQAIQDCVRRLHEGEWLAKVNLFCLGLREIFPVAYGWHHKWIVWETGYDILDLVQEGNISLWLSISSFSGSSRKDFRDFVRNIAREGIKRALKMAGASVKIDDEMTFNIRRVSRAWNKLYKKFGREPDVHELAKQLGMHPQEVENTIKSMRISVPSTVSLDQKIKKDDDGDDYYHVIADAKSLPPDETLEKIANDLRDKWFTESLESSLQTLLSPIEQYVLSQRFGFKGEAITQTAVASLLRMPPEKVEEIEEGALAKLRANGEIAEKMRRFAFWWGKE